MIGQAERDRRIFHTIPEMSNFDSPPAKPEDRFLINPDVAQEFTLNLRECCDTKDLWEN